MNPCFYHPGRHAARKIADREYCAECLEGIEKAQTTVDRHVEPKDCFVWYQKGKEPGARPFWNAIWGTGCAHWVAHQLDIHVGPRSKRKSSPCPVLA